MIGPTRPGARSNEHPVAGPSRLAVAGPSLPHVHNDHGVNDDDDDDEDEDEAADSYGPSLPAHLVKKAQRPTQLGPALPQHLQRQQNHSDDNHSSDEDDSDDDQAIGPSAPPNLGKNALVLSEADEFRLREKQREEEKEAARRAAEGKSKREDWMLVPPTELDFVGKSDPTKINKRGFNQDSRRSGTAADKGQPIDQTLWTETPKERAKRLDDEIMGKRKKTENAGQRETDSEKRERKLREARDLDLRSKVDTYNSAARGDSLVDQHRVRSAAEALEAEERARKKAKRSKQHRKASRSPSPEAPAFWDREKMMGSGGRLMDERKRKEVIGGSSEGLKSKFGGGTFL